MKIVLPFRLGEDDEAVWTESHERPVSLTPPAACPHMKWSWWSFLLSDGVILKVRPWPCLQPALSGPCEACVHLNSGSLAND